MAACMTNSISRSSLRPRDFDTQAPKICIAKLLRRSTFRAPQSTSDSQLHRLWLRPWSSVITASEKFRSPDSRNRPHVYQDRRSDEASLEHLGGSSRTNEDRDYTTQNVASTQENESRDASSVCGGQSCVEFEVDYIEWHVDGPEAAVSHKTVSKLCNASKKSARVAEVSVQTSFGEENLKLLIALGANEEQRALIRKRHPEFGGLPSPPFLMESVQLFQEFGMDSQVLMRVIAKFNKARRYNIFINAPPHKPKLVLTFLRDKIGVQNLGKVVVSSHTMLGLSLETLRESVKNLESLGVVVNGDFVENYGVLLLLSRATLKEKAKALEKAFGSRCFLKHPLLFNVKAEDVAKRVANLQDILGEDLAKEYLGKEPTILLSRVATVRELWYKLNELSSGSELLTRIRCRPNILGKNWKTLNYKFEYLASKGFTQDEMLSNISMISSRSFEKFIKPNVEQALKSCRTQEDRPELKKILCQSRATFERRFGAN